MARKLKPCVKPTHVHGLIESLPLTQFICRELVDLDSKLTSSLVILILNLVSSLLEMASDLVQ